MNPIGVGEIMATTSQTERKIEAQEGREQERVVVGRLRRRSFGRLRRILVVTDAAAVMFAGLAVGFLLLPLFDRSVDWDPSGWLLLAMLPVWTAVAYGFGLYHDFERRLDRSFVLEAGRVAVAAALWNWIFIFLRALAFTGFTTLLPLALLWLVMVPGLLVSRSVVRAVAVRRPWGRQTVALLGDAGALEQLSSRLDRHPEWGVEVGLRVPTGELLDRGTTAAGAAAELASRMAAAGIVRVMIADQAGRFGSIVGLAAFVQALNERALTVDLVTGGAENLYTRSISQDLEGLPLVTIQPPFPRPLALASKRAFDIVVGGIGLVLASPLILVASVAIRLDSPGPSIYRSRRVGRDDVEFEALKLRTMIEDADAQRPALREGLDREGGDVLFKIEDDPRMTRVGRTLRSWSIDELPQLWNVLKGEMSLVGPRPLPPEEAERAEALFAARTRMRPGLAGPWQALGRSSIPFDDMVRLDYSYVTGWSFSGDLVLLLRTASAVVRRHGAL